MHGRLKVKTTEEQMKAKQIEKEQKIRIFKEMKNKIIDCRKKNDNSLSILNLLAECLLKAPEWNLFWNYRREILINLNLNEDLMVKELSLTERCLKENSKAYSVWHHRCWVLQNSNSPDWLKELELSNSALKLDERNFHCWDYRRFVVENGKVPVNEEFQLTERQILDNISNYSSWHYRSTMLANKSIPLEVSNELDLINNSVFTDPVDQSPWFYLRFLIGGFSRRKPFIRELYVTRKLKSIVLITSEPVPEKFMADVKVTIRTVIDDRQEKEEKGNEEKERKNNERKEEDKEKMEERGNYSSSTPSSPLSLLSWKSVLDRNVSSVWLQPLEDPIDSQERNGKLIITVTCGSMPDFCWRCQLDGNRRESLIRVDTDINRQLCDTVSQEIPLDVLADELELVRELERLEQPGSGTESKPAGPEAKWVHMATIAILRVIDPLESRGEIERRVDLLKKIDPDRNRFYDDMWSKYRIECELIERYATHQRVVALSNVGLTSLTQLSWMALMTDIDFSRNRLTVIPDQFRYLVCVTRLNLSSNQLTSLENVRGLRSLRDLDVSDNRIARYGDLEAVFDCIDLVTLNIRGNAVSQLTNLTELVASHPSSKLHLTSISIIYDKLI